jgi:hypothetical protein
MSQEAQFELKHFSKPAHSGAAGRPEGEYVCFWFSPHGYINEAWFVFGSFADWQRFSTLAANSPPIRCEIRSMHAGLSECRRFTLAAYRRELTYFRANTEAEYWLGFIAAEHLDPEALPPPRRPPSTTAK